MEYLTVNAPNDTSTKLKALVNQWYEARKERETKEQFEAELGGYIKAEKAAGVRKALDRVSVKVGKELPNDDRYGMDREDWSGGIEGYKIAISYLEAAIQEERDKI